MLDFLGEAGCRHPHRAACEDAGGCPGHDPEIGDAVVGKALEGAQCHCRRSTGSGWTASWSPWDDARVHILTHSLHYGSGVFEGIRAYADRSGSGGVPPHRPHPPAVRQRQGVPDRHPVHARRADRGGQGDDPGQRARRLLHPAPRLPRLRRDGPQPAAVPGQRVDRGVAVGHVPGRRGPRATACA